MHHEHTSLLKQANLKATPARLALLCHFESLKEPITAEELFNALGKRIDIVTIYRNLQVFLKTHILKRIDLRQGSVSYELASKHHHHIVCDTCGMIEDFHSKAEQKLLDDVLSNSKKFSLIKDHSLELFGVCKHCIKKQAL